MGEQHEISYPQQSRPYSTYLYFALPFLQLHQHIIPLLVNTILVLFRNHQISYTLSRCCCMRRIVEDLNKQLVQGQRLQICISDLADLRFQVQGIFEVHQD